jgi:hypothetical protein
MAGNEQPQDHNFNVTVLVDGKPKTKHFPANLTVLEAIRDSLPPADKPNASDFMMVDKRLGTSALSDNSTLAQAGVQDEDVLSITKKAGGGGQ